MSEIKEAIRSEIFTVHKGCRHRIEGFKREKFTQIISRVFLSSIHLFLRY